MKTIAFPKIDSQVYGIIRVGKREHLEMLADGHLRFRHLSYYWGPESKGKQCNDSDENIFALFQSKDYKVSFGEISLNKIGLTEAIKIKKNDSEQYVACFHALYASDFPNGPLKKDDLSSFRKALEIPESMSGFGHHIWIIHDFQEFLARLITAATKEKLKLRGDLVSYVDFNEANGFVSDEATGFVKSCAFKHEREYRLAVSGKLNIPDPYTLELGSLRDISSIGTLSEFNRRFEIIFDRS